MESPRFQDTGNKNEKEDVVSEYEDKIDCCGDHHSHRLCDIFVNLPWVDIINHYHICAPCNIMDP
ncbi:vesicle-associated membrane protein 726 [Prunus dulcis]|uniref:Vesicle-associated membrane protein 726 n=1 Tax=Prunus dulcis TaxID=3755 RepID=A0A4Y1R2K2_PRUDU|nr:vesicle-associated membrane protein 726 [Prunus dulcis]